ncbi:hypothetical protein PENSPDRAFT_650142 [Peniophora sp. CONT]|nr:hypothetical protein PENSPDRAFT_650142 [Peniophora sp. CONT]
MVSGVPVQTEEQPTVADLGPLVVQYNGMKAAIPRVADYTETLSLIKQAIEALSTVPNANLLLYTTMLPDHIGKIVVVNGPVWPTIVFGPYLTLIKVEWMHHMRREYHPNWEEMIQRLHEEEEQQEHHDVPVIRTSTSSWFNAQLTGSGDRFLAAIGRVATSWAKSHGADMFAIAACVRSKSDTLRQDLSKITRDQVIVTVKIFLVAAWTIYNTCFIVNKEMEYYEFWRSSHGLEESVLHHHYLQGSLCLVGNVTAGILVFFVLQSWLLQLAVIAQVAFNLTMM